MRVRSVSEIWDRYHHVAHGHELRSKWSKYQHFATTHQRPYYGEDSISGVTSSATEQQLESFRPVVRKSSAQTKKINDESARNDNFIRGVKSLGLQSEEYVS
ncbi:MAG: hypothetical protein J6A36_02620 [Clostridia bacterium]|nr:hypothetical protein [Clostridia bacterium]